jgi:hypothetical protein
MCSNFVLPTSLSLHFFLYLNHVDSGRMAGRITRGRLGSFDFFTSRDDILARFVNEPARELNELLHFSKTKLYAYCLRMN